MRITKALMLKVQTDYLNTIKDMSDDDIASILTNANKKYRAGEPVLTDSVYDSIEEFLREKNSEHPVLRQVGEPAKLIKGKKEALPFYMGSMDKVKNIESFVKKFASPDGFVLSEKLDGNSAMLYINNKKVTLFSRGDGKMGQNISHIIPYIQGLPQAFIASATQKQSNYCVRGEIIISRKDFEKNKDMGANARNLCAGLLNTKVADPAKLKMCKFVAYSLIQPEGLTVVDQFAQLAKNKFEVVVFKKVNEINHDILTEYITERHSKSEYEIDGIIVCDNKAHEVEQDKNPSYAFAFKDFKDFKNVVQVEIKNVEWNISKDGYIVPVVEFDGVQLSGVTIKRATAFNAQYIKDNCIGPGSQIEIMRSGLVIPYITKILSKSKSGKPQYPTDIEFKWNDSGKDIIVVGENQQVDFKQLDNFFGKIKITGLSTGLVKKLNDNGYDTIKKILNIKQADLAKLPGMGEKSASNIFNAIQEKMPHISCVDLMDASNAFGRGFGSTRLKAIVDGLGDKGLAINDKKTKISIEELIEIPGISNITAEKFLTGLVQYHDFYKQLGFDCMHGMHGITKEKPNTQDIPPTTCTDFIDKIIVFTGFRDKTMQDYIEKCGGKVTAAVSGKTTLLVAKSIDEDSTKIKGARAKNIQVMSKDDFIAKYKLEGRVLIHS